MKEIIERKSLIWAAVAFVAGLLIGWLLLGWVIWPVRWINADPFDLRQEYKEAYIAMVADSYSLNMDLDLVRRRTAGWDKEEMGEIIAELQARASDEVEARRLANLAHALGVTVERRVAPTPEATVQPEIRLEGAFLVRRLLLIIGLSVGALVVIVVTMLSIGVWRGRREAGAEERVVPRWLARKREARAAIGPFISTYSWGDDDFQESFNIKAPDGEIVGGCGMHTLECLDVGRPDRVLAFRVWLLDKKRVPLSGINVVLMSEDAYQSFKTRSRLGRKGEPILAEPGQEFTLETTALRVDGLVTEMEYGREEDLPPKSFFTTLAVELTPTLKGTQEETQQS